MSKTYAALHAHSDYSNLKVIDSINKIPDLIDNAFEKGLYSIALTDHDTISGHIKAIRHYKKKYSEEKNFKLILGNEIYITKEGMSADTYEKGDKFYHLLLLSLDEIGHKQIRQLSTRAWDRSFTKSIMRTPTYPSDLKEIIGQNQGHIVASTACLGGISGTLFTVYGEDSLDMIQDQLKKLELTFGKGNFFIELQPSNQIDQINYNKFMVKHFWDKYPFIFSTDAHYLNKEDSKIHKQFLNSISGESREVDQFYSSAFIMTTEEVESALNYIDAAKIEEMRLNTIRIADRATIYDLKHPQVVPTVPVDITDEIVNTNSETLSTMPLQYDYIRRYLLSDERNDYFFIYKIFEGLNQRVKNIDAKYLSRLEYELEQVWETSVSIKQALSKYFITMARMIDIIWNDGDSLLGVSRGSAVGFLVNYCLGITQIDPLAQALELPAWRFIHKDRPELPDIDIDTEGNKRVKVFNKVQQYFNSIGGDVVNVCTFGTEKSKSALRTAGRGLGIEDEVISYMVSMVPNERGFDWTLSQCMYGDDEHKPITKFQDEMAKNKDLWPLASKIEGLITRIGVHASGIVALNEDITEYNSLMKTSRGAKVTAFNLDDTEYAGGLKYDFLTVNALDKIRTTMNLLLEDGVIDWEGDLRSTYNKYLLPINLDYTSSDMWQMAHEGGIVDLFQFDTPVGAQAVKNIRPKNIAELSVANSIMRLMADEDGAELPLDTYVRFKNDLRQWYVEMKHAGLNDTEVKILEKYLLPLSGVADSQESVMLLTMDENISNFTVTEANSLRKAITKKKFDVLEETKKMFFEKGKITGTSQFLLDYVWNIQIMRQAGYSFSVLHTMGYSTIALQEMNLAYRFPLIYWNTACLSVNAGAVNKEDYEVLIEDGIVELDENDDDKRESNKVQYGKVAAAISRFRDNFGLKISLPDINKARFGFTPDAEKNEVLFGLKGITRIGEDLIRTIITTRPYESLEHFLSKINSDDRKVISKEKVVMLIKAGAFDNLESRPREEILKDFILSVADQKKRITLQNMAMLITYNLVPDELEFEKKVYNYTKYLRKNKYKDFYYELDDVSQAFYSESAFDENKLEVVDEKICILLHDWDYVHEKYMDNVRAWMKKEQDSILLQLNTILFDEEYQKYAEGNILTWELDSLNFYHSGHELIGIGETFPMEVNNINEIPDREVIGQFNIQGKTFPKYQIRHIIGTVLDKDKQKHIVTLSTPHGIITVKVYRTQFSSYDKVNFIYNEDGEKVIVQDSFFKKGTFLLVSGIKDGELFIPKVYKEHGISPILKFDIEEYKFKKAYEKL